MIDPTLAGILAQLSDVTTRNTVGAIQTRITTAKATKQNENTINELTEIINQLVQDRVELVGIATALQEQLVAQQISADEIAYITEKLIPAVERIISLSGSGQPREEGQIEAVEAIKALVSVEMLTVLQLVGFNFKAAIGEPLTDLVATAIARLAPKQPGGSNKRQPRR